MRSLSAGIGDDPRDVGFFGEFDAPFVLDFLTDNKLPAERGAVASIFQPQELNFGVTNDRSSIFGHTSYRVLQAGFSVKTAGELMKGDFADVALDNIANHIINGNIDASDPCRIEGGGQFPAGRSQTSY